MFGGTDARRDESGSHEPLEVPEELDSMDADTDATTDFAADGTADDTDDSYDTDDRPAGGDDADAEVAYAPLDTTPDVLSPPVTGDEAVDEAMTRLARAQAGSLADRIESGEHAHRSLQSRLGGLGGA